MTALHTQTANQALTILDSTLHGLSIAEAHSRLGHYGPNAMPQPTYPGLGQLFFKQFISPLIYVLTAAAVFSLIIQEWSDAGFITAVLIVNAIIGTIQEYSAQQAAIALQQLVTTSCRVLRGGDTYEIDARELVPGDIILLESGDRIPADIRLLTSNDLEIDESLLTGESIAVLKDANTLCKKDTVIGDRFNMAFAGTLVNRGRSQGVVAATGLNTELGAIATAVLGKQTAKAPLLVRMEKFTHKVAIIVAIAAILMAAIAFMRGMAFADMFMLAVALAVSAIPEGLPVALTVTLAIGMKRMAKRHVIIRQLIAVEALGSCTYIATDKTGTLTVNQLTVRRILIPGQTAWQVEGESLIPEGEFVTSDGPLTSTESQILKQLCQTAVLTNEGFIGHRQGGWTHHGDSVDVALLIMAHKAGIIQAETLNSYPELASIAFESERQFSASLNSIDHVQRVSVKGALEQLLTMCSTMQTLDGTVAIDPEQLHRQAHELASQGYRVIALAIGDIQLADNEVFCREHLQVLTLIGLVGLIDPLRPEAQSAVAACHQAGIQVAMVTGDHPTTACAIALDLKLIESDQQVITGPQMKTTRDQIELDHLISQARVFARVEPQQKLDIVQSLQRNGHFVAVSGDGANDAPALRAAQVGVAMGKHSTDVARESAEIIITDDNFSSIVAGIEEGRIAYANVRKVIFLLISTGAAELVLFTLSLIAGLPIPLLAVQLLWLNLVTNGIQDIALAFEPSEGNELHHPPRSPKESIFNRLMIERVILSALVMGCVAFFIFQQLLNSGLDVEAARNATLLLMVLFENVHVFNSRSEVRTTFLHNPMSNPLLLFGTLTAQLIHIAAMYTPWLKDVLQVQPVSLELWTQLLGFALTVLLVMEIHKLLRKNFRI